MATRFLRPNILARYSFYQELSKTSVLGINFSSNNCHSISVGSKSSNDVKKLKIKKKQQFSDNGSHGSTSDTVKKNTFFETRNVEEISSFNAENLEENDIAKDLFKKIQNIQNQTFSHSLASYISVCNYSELYDEAFSTFKHFKNLEKNSSDSKSLNLKPYNEVLIGIANQGDLNKMKEVMISLEESSLQPDYNTIAYCLTCLGRNENTPSVIDEIKIILELMDQHNITLYEILRKAYFPRDSLEWCLQAIERMPPNLKDELRLAKSFKDDNLKENCYNNELLNNLNESIFMNQGKSPSEGTISHHKLKEMVQRQIDNELKGYLEIPLISARNITPAREEEKKLWEEWNEDWRKNLYKTLEKYKTFMNKGFSDSESIRINEFPYLNVLSNKEIVDLLLQEVRNLCSDLTVKTYNEMAYNLGHKFYNRFQIRYKENSHIFSTLAKVYEKYTSWYLLQSNSDASYIPRVEWNYILAKEDPTMNWKDNPVEWPYTVKLAIGHKLYKFIFDSLRVWEHGRSPTKAFSIFRGDRTNKNKMVPSKDLMKIFNKVFEDVLFPTVELPMFSPPIPWTDVNNGGYIFTKSRFVNLTSPKYQSLLWIEEEKMHKLYPAMDTLNALGSVPWKINCNMLDTIIEVFNDGGWSEMGVFPYMSRENIDKTDKDERKKFRWAQGMRDLQLDTLSIANYYRNSIFWIPHQVDFRGRSYSIVRKFSHFLPDLYRSFIIFAQGRKLGKDGLTWLKLHICNLSGMKKLSSVEDRVKFVDEIIDEIIDSAKNPLNGNKWWTRCSLPWQTLAACKELVAVLESECPENYVCHLPIHQDGSCNVLQHFAALSRDKEGAATVNLSPSNTPQDLYSFVADSVKKIVQEDANKAIAIAPVLKNYINRKMIKTAVIASIYGISGSDGHLSIAKKLRECGFIDEYIGPAADYLAPKTYETLNSTFLSLKPVKDWMVKLAEGISQHCVNNIDFQSPLGFPVEQSNTKESPSFPFQTDLITSFIPGSLFEKPSIDDQKSGFPGNFIQSMDASHMMLTSLHCQQAGVTFVSIHDSFWSHPSTIPAMNKICREQFIQLYSQPILEDLAKYFIQKYSSHPNYRHCYTTLSDEDPTPASLELLLHNIPQKGDFDLNEVLRSTFFFS